MPVMVEPQIRALFIRGAQEKNDNLRMALAVGQILNDHGVDVGYTRVQDVYQSPLQKAQMANNWDADYFVSFHRSHASSRNRFRNRKPDFFKRLGKQSVWLPISIQSLGRPAG